MQQLNFGFAFIFLFALVLQWESCWAEKCFDVTPNCPFLESRGFCVARSAVLKRMKSLCRKTCGFCTETVPTTVAPFGSFTEGTTGRSTVPEKMKDNWMTTKQHPSPSEATRLTLVMHGEAIPKETDKNSVVVNGNGVKNFAEKVKSDDTLKSSKLSVDKETRGKDDNEENKDELSITDKGNLESTETSQPTQQSMVLTERQEKSKEVTTQPLHKAKTEEETTMGETLTTGIAKKELSKMVQTTSAPAPSTEKPQTQDYCKNSGKYPHGHCKYWKRKGLCEMKKWYLFMKDHCRKTCQMCDM